MRSQKPVRGSQIRAEKRPSDLPRFLSLLINEFGEVGRANQPRRFLAAQPEGFARQQLGGRATARLLVAKPEVFRSYLVERNVASPNSARRPKNVFICQPRDRTML